MSSTGVKSRALEYPDLVLLFISGIKEETSRPSGITPVNEENDSLSIEPATPSRAPLARSVAFRLKLSDNSLTIPSLIFPRLTSPLSAPTRRSLAAVFATLESVDVNCPVTSPSPGISPPIASEICSSKTPNFSFKPSVKLPAKSVPTCAPIDCNAPPTPSPEIIPCAADFAASERSTDTPAIFSSPKSSGINPSTRSPVKLSKLGGNPPSATFFNMLPISSFPPSPPIGKSVFKSYKDPLLRALDIFFALSIKVLPPALSALTVGVS